MIFTKKIIKYVAIFNAIPLSHIINCFLLAGIVPSNFKVAKVVLINENSKRHDPYDYRPVSIVHGFSKIIEKLIANRLFSFLGK